MKQNTDHTVATMRPLVDAIALEISAGIDRLGATLGESYQEGVRTHGAQYFPLPPVPAGSTNPPVTFTAGPGRFMGFAIQGAAAGGSVSFYDGDASRGGELVLTVSPTTAPSLVWFGPGGISLRHGLALVAAGGTFTGSVFLTPERDS